MKSQSDKLFCDICLDLGFLSQDQIEQACSKQSVDAAEGNKTRIESYFLEANMISSEQHEILKKVMAKCTAPSPSMTNAIKQPMVKESEVLEAEKRMPVVDSGESIEKGICPICGECMVKVHQQKFRPGCLGCSFHAFMILITSGFWLLPVGLWAIIREVKPKETKACLKCGQLLKKDS